MRRRKSYSGQYYSLALIIMNSVFLSGCVSQSSAKSDDFASTMKGKTIELSGYSKSCSTVVKTFCLEQTNSLRMYVSNSGNIFSYFDDSNGVVIPKGRNSAEHIIKSDGKTDKINFTYRDGNLSVTAGVYSDSGHRYILTYKAKIEDSSCNIVYYKLSNYFTNRNAKLRTTSKPIKCKIRRGK